MKNFSLLSAAAKVTDCACLIAIRPTHISHVEIKLFLFAVFRSGQQHVIASADRYDVLSGKSKFEHGKEYTITIWRAARVRPVIGSLQKAIQRDRQQTEKSRVKKAFVRWPVAGRHSGDIA